MRQRLAFSRVHVRLLLIANFSPLISSGLSILNGGKVDATASGNNTLVETFKTDKLGQPQTIYSTLIEENPDYVNYHDDLNDNDQSDDDDDLSDDNQSEDDQSDDDDDDDDDANDKEINKAVDYKTTKIKDNLSNSLRKTKHKQFVWTKKWKHHRASITLAVAIYAFRNELLALFIYLVEQTVKNFSFTDFLKLILFLNFLWRIQTGDFLSSDDKSLDGSPWFSPWLRLLPSNPAYIPPITQHYTFERSVQVGLSFDFK
jgi:hypothetical protein